MVARGLDLSGSGLVTVEGCCRHGAELFVFYKLGEILYWLFNCWLRRNSFTRWNWLPFGTGSVRL